MSDGSTEQQRMTAGLDLGDKFTHLCLIDTENGQVIEEGPLAHHCGGSVDLSGVGLTFSVGAGSFRALRKRAGPAAQEAH